MIAGRLVNREVEPFSVVLNVKLLPSEIALLTQALESYSNSCLAAIGDRESRKIIRAEAAIKDAERLLGRARAAQELRELFLDDDSDKPRSWNSLQCVPERKKE